MEDTKEDLLRKARALRKARSALYDQVRCADVIDAIDALELIDPLLAQINQILTSAERDLLRRAENLPQKDKKDC